MTSVTKAAPMTRDETKLLVQLVAANTVIMSKATNAVTNKIKDEAWQSLASEFNSAISSFPRTTNQLRLKWENLKKSARKRCASMRSSLNKTGGGKDYFPPDEVLDQVMTLLGNTCTGFTVEFGGDAVEIDSVVSPDDVENLCIDSLIANKEGDDGIGGGIVVSGEGVHSSEKELNILLKTPTEKKSFYFGKASGKATLGKRKFKLNEDLSKARVQRENALTEYLQAKKKKIDIETENAQLMLENTKLQNLKLRKELGLD
ncbi:uncharacterized protein LOC123722427 [Papilio machaon]|uniref:uncharacterized protein LOC123722427 n=1 Tax=Papilio machaon TaxID=76193 RepID=UPI001E664591|nr:uncharacterized protein LOC123722427 [Papilio machaon]